MKDSHETVGATLFLCMLSALSTAAASSPPTPPASMKPATHSARYAVSATNSENYAIEYPGGAAPGDVSGAIDDDDFNHHRVDPGCQALSTTGFKSAYDTVTFTNTGANTATVTVRMGLRPDPRGSCPLDTPFDPFLAIYEGTFDPANACPDASRQMTIPTGRTTDVQPSQALESSRAVHARSS